jgi:hypothetical protein
MALGGGHVHNGTTMLQEYESKIPGRFVNEGDFSLKIFIAKEGNS